MTFAQAFVKDSTHHVLSRFVGISEFGRALAFYRPVLASWGIWERLFEPERPWAGWESTPGHRPLFVIARPFDGEVHNLATG